MKSNHDIHAPFRLVRGSIEATTESAFVHQRVYNEEGILDPDTTESIFERSNDSTTTDDENSCARVNHVSADIFIQRDRTVGRNETEEEAQAELHNATRETQEWKKPLAVGKWPWARYRSVFGHDGFIVEIYTLYTPLRIVISKVERISRGMFIYINIYISIVRFDNGRVFPEKNSRIVFWIRLWKDASNWKASWITCERKKLNDNPFSSVYDSRCYELWRRECNVYFLAWRCNNSGEEWLIVLFLQTMYLGIFSLWDVLWPCFILNFCFTHLLLLLSMHTHYYRSFFYVLKFHWIVFNNLWILATIFD